MTRRLKARPLDRDAGAPLWTQLEADLHRRLRAGAFDRGFPGELELAAEYGVSRHTVREALRRMRADGVLQSDRGRGTSLGPRAFEQPLGALYSLFRSVEQAGVEQRSEVRSLELRADPTVAAQLGLAPDTEMVFLERLRLAGGQPLALDRSWLARSLAEPLLHGDFARSGLYDELSRLTGTRLTGGREVIRAVVPDAGTRRLLGIGTTTAALAVERTGCLDARPVEFRRSIIRGDRFAMVAEWGGRDGYRVDVSHLDGATHTRSDAV